MTSKIGLTKSLGMTLRQTRHVLTCRFFMSTTLSVLCCFGRDGVIIGDCRGRQGRAMIKGCACPSRRCRRSLWMLLVTVIALMGVALFIQSPATADHGDPRMRLGSLWQPPKYICANLHAAVLLHASHACMHVNTGLKEDCCVGGVIFSRAMS